MSASELNGYYFEDISPGMTASFGKAMTEADVVMFAGVSGDIVVDGSALIWVPSHQS